MPSGGALIPADSHARPRDACGVVGVITAGGAADTAVRAYRGLGALQHRGD